MAVPIDLSNQNDQVYLVLYGTGLRGHAQAPICYVGETLVEVSYAGAQSAFAGLDQVNVKLPRSLAGSGLVDVLLTFDGQVANPARILIK